MDVRALSSYDFSLGTDVYKKAETISLRFLYYLRENPSSSRYSAASG